MIDFNNSIPEVFNRTGHGLTENIIAWANVEPVLHPEFFGQDSTYIY